MRRIPPPQLMHGVAADLLRVTCPCCCSWGKQVWVLYRQALLAQLRNPSDTAGRIYVTVLINLLVSEAKVLEAVMQCSDCATSVWWTTAASHDMPVITCQTC